MAVKRGLGKGIDSLIPAKPVEEKKVEVKENTESSSAKNGFINVKLSMVEPNRKQPRKVFNEDKLQELADSIKQVGFLQPILVQDRKTYYEIIAGERRWRAAKLLGLKEVPVIVKELSEQEQFEISLIENIQRDALNPIEEANAYKSLLTEYNLKQDELAERVCKSRTAVTNSMRLLKLCDEVQKMVMDEMITTGHARALISVEDPQEQYMLAQKIFDEKLSVREVEKMIKNLHKPEKTKKVENESLKAVYSDISERLRQSLSTKVSINAKGNGAGKIEIEFYNHEDLERLLEHLSRS
ncbi:MAG: ParB/RepB/Spo0J family partition protein [Lachnospiraceae bacterium]|nr:ParB/RepB/Spo0J family partition protein [Lachnospiraceae bacterium]